MGKVRVTKTEWLLLGLTAVFLCGLLALSWRDRAAGPGVTVETAVQAPPEDVVPEFPLLDLNTASAEEPCRAERRRCVARSRASSSATEKGLVR